MTHQYVHVSNIAEFSKAGYLFRVEEHSKEPSISGDMPRYAVIRRKLGDKVEEITQSNLTVREAMRYLAHAAEDGSLLNSDVE